MMNIPLLKSKITCNNPKCKNVFIDYISNKRKFCSKKCFYQCLHKTKKSRQKLSSLMKGRFTGNKNPAWVGGKILSGNGYIQIYSPSHPNRNKDGYVYEHRLMVESHIGRYLNSNEHVHHKNGVRADNRIENLELLTSSDHHKLHWVKMIRKNVFKTCSLYGRSNVKHDTILLCHNCYQKQWRKKHNV